MTSRFFLPVMCIFVACGGFADADNEAVTVSYYGFEIERITGIHEEEIEELGCTYSAEADTIDSALSEVDSSDVAYDRRDVRAKIQMHGKSYFVDRAGVVRQGDDYYRLDKARFIASLTLVGECE